jgi:cell wall-associated NlpC family hydrolase
LSHVGIYIGDGRMISAENERTGVRVANIWDRYWGPRFHSARRLG